MVTAFFIPVFSVRTTFRALEYWRKDEAVKYSSKLLAVGFQKTLTKSCSEEISVTSPTGPLVELKAYAPILVDTAGIILVKSFSCTRTPGDTWKPLGFLLFIICFCI